MTHVPVTQNIELFVDIVFGTGMWPNSACNKNYRAKIIALIRDFVAYQNLVTHLTMTHCQNVSYKPHALFAIFKKQSRHSGTQCCKARHDGISIRPFLRQSVCQ